MSKSSEFQKFKATSFTNVKKLNNEEIINELASMFSSLGGKAKVSKEREAIIDLFAQGKIDYETACFSIKRSFK